MPVAQPQHFNNTIILKADSGASKHFVKTADKKILNNVKNHIQLQLSFLTRQIYGQNKGAHYQYQNFSPKKLNKDMSYMG